MNYPNKLMNKLFFLPTLTDILLKIYRSRLKFGNFRFLRVSCWKIEAWGEMELSSYSLALGSPNSTPNLFHISFHPVQISKIHPHPQQREG
jgi:hypothetical protein